ncbi:putative sodium-coupled neutral amino acid transporter 10 isoform X2 [Cephus cinctus]|uniref:Sodium-coupled neutral amino acid transporter 10 isoform X2 n=1 Tax=Cephus cinctus TaxID=211228 RepID=A0AAJ7RA32_CEPCN|nr:putative sodium-coupled neutral amino acid transporter 10 isoform X2 [Cephus cinctus]
MTSHITHVMTLANSIIGVIGESTPHVFAGDWYDHVYYWRPSGILQCLPIFSMALFCQTQLFEIYEAIPNVCLEKMNEVVRGALNICTMVYVCVGFFGYIAFCTQPFTGNILMNFEPSLTSEVIKMGFVLSVAFSYPLVIFPCRASMNSLLFRKAHSHESTSNYMPEMRFRCLTFTIVIVSLIIGILIPSIEFVLGLVGSTIGVMICLIFPAAFFISISSKNTNERLAAQAILFVGLWIMILGTYANLYAMEESTNTRLLATTNKPSNQINNVPLSLMRDEKIPAIPDIPKTAEILRDVHEKLTILKLPEKKPEDPKEDVRQEPPIPVERVVITEKPLAETYKTIDILGVTLLPKIKKNVEKIKIDNKLADDKKIDEMINEKSKEKIKNQNELQRNDNLIDSDAIKKEELELAADGELADIQAAERHNKLERTLEKHRIEQFKMIQVQKEILQDLKQRKQELQKERIAKSEKVTDLPPESKPEKAENLKRINLEPVARTKPKDTDPSEIQKKAEKSNVKMNISGGKGNGQVVDNQKVNQNDKADKREAPNKKEVPEIIANNISGAVEATAQNYSHQKEVLNLNKTSASAKKRQGPILSALARNISKEMALSSNDIKQSILMKDSNTIYKNSVVETEKNIPASDVKKPSPYSVPIALMMNNPTRKNDNPNGSNLIDKENAGFHRDILEDHEREKRDVGSYDTENIEVKSFARDVVLKNDRKICDKSTGDSVKNIQEKSDTTTDSEILIKTNIYLSEQGFTDNMSVDSNVAVATDFVKIIKKRDLKALHPSNNIRK